MVIQLSEKRAPPGTHGARAVITQPSLPEVSVASSFVTPSQPVVLAAVEDSRLDNTNNNTGEPLCARIALRDALLLGSGGVQTSPLLDDAAITAAAGETRLQRDAISN
jgi:hypothetical protein